MRIGQWQFDEAATYLNYNQKIAVKLESSGLPSGRRKSAAFDDVHVGRSKDCRSTFGRHGGRRTRIGRETPRPAWRRQVNEKAKSKIYLNYL